MIGKIISHYKILELLGRGGMGTVYKAQDTKLDRFVALKFLPRHLGQTEEEKQRFIHEAKAASALDHPNICTIYQIDETEEGQLFIVMAYYAGESLREKISRGSLSIKEALEIAIQVARGLNSAHEKGITHRDIKPANIMITDHSEAKIVDFGLAKLAGWTRLTKSDSTVGTAAYMSPEQSRGEGVDHRTDIWSFGVVLYEMISGKHPFRGDYEQAVVYSIMNEDPEPLEGIPQPMERLVFKALEKRADERFQTVHELLMHLLPVKKIGYQKSSSSFALSGSKTTIFAKKRFVRLLTPILFAVGIFSLFLWQNRIAYEAEVPTAESRRLSIAVPYFDNNTGDSELNWLSKGIPDMLMTDFSRSKYVQVVSMEKLLDVLRALDGENSQEIDRSTAMEISKRAKAHVLVTGSIIQSGAKFRIIAQLTNLKSNLLFSTANVETESLGLIIETVERLSSKIRLALEIEASGTPEIAAGIAQTKTSSLEAYKHYIIGREKILKSYHQEAITDLRKAVQIDSTFVQAYDALAYVYFYIGEESLADKLIQTALRFSANLSETEKLRIELRLAQINGDPNLQLAYLKRLVVLQPEEPEWHFKLGWHHATFGRAYERSIFEYEKAIGLELDADPRFYFYLGLACFKARRTEDAIHALRKYVSLLPDEASSHNELGFAYMLTGHYDKALEEFETALQLKGDFAPAFASLGELHLARGMTQSALSYYCEYLARASNDSDERDAHYYLANFFLETGDFAEAEKEIELAQALDEEMLAGFWTLGLIKLKQKDPHTAQILANRIEKMIEESNTLYEKELLHHLRGMIYLQEKRFALAIGEFQEALLLGPEDPAIFGSALAQAYFLNGDLDESIAACKQVLDFNPNHAHSLMMLGQIYEQKGMIPEAIVEYETVLEILKDADEDMPQLKEAQERVIELRSEVSNK